VGAINGSVGCALLLFVIPCAIDLKLNGRETVMNRSFFFEPKVFSMFHLSISFTSLSQGTLLWWRCVTVALIGICGGVFALKLSIQSIVVK
jgi:hypothetical protein